MRAACAQSAIRVQPHICMCFQSQTADLTVLYWGRVTRPDESSLVILGVTSGAQVVQHLFLLLLRVVQGHPYRAPDTGRNEPQKGRPDGVRPHVFSRELCSECAVTDRVGICAAAVVRHMSLLGDCICKYTAKPG